jgi:hypothetical protein
MWRPEMVKAVMGRDGGGGGGDRCLHAICVVL